LINVDALLNATLAKMKLPVSRSLHTGNEDQFLVFNGGMQQEIDFADDDAETEEYHYAVNLYSRKDYITQLQKLKKLLKQAGFVGITVQPDLYEEDTGYHHIPIDLHYKIIMED